MPRTWFLSLVVFVCLAPVARAQSHEYINTMRSSTTSSVFIEESVEGEYGKHLATGNVPGEDGQPKATSSDQYWKGYGISTTIGLEIMKFIQFEAGHTFVNLHYRDDALESLTGSRLHAGVRAVFSAPIANLELGSGLTGARLDYQKQLEQASFYGSGVYYSLGLNYFTSSRVSFYLEAKTMNEHLVRSSGTSGVQGIDTEMTLMGLGFRIWL